MNYLRTVVSGILTIGFLLVAISSAGGLLWALVDARHATRTLGSNFPLVALGEMIITLYALGRGITFLQKAGTEHETQSKYVGHSFRK